LSATKPSRLLDGSGVSREAPAPFCEGLGVQFPRPTHHPEIVVCASSGFQSLLQRETMRETILCRVNG